MQLFLSKIFSSTTPPAGDWLWSHPANCSKTHFLSSKMPATQHVLEPPGFLGKASARAFVMTILLGTICRGKGAQRATAQSGGKGVRLEFYQQKKLLGPWPCSAQAAYDPAVTTGHAFHFCSREVSGYWIHNSFLLHLDYIWRQVIWKMNLTFPQLTSTAKNYQMSFKKRPPPPPHAG